LIERHFLGWMMSASDDRKGEWRPSGALIITQDQKTGRPRHDDRLMLNGILWVLCSGAAWRDMPERFGPWSTVYQRFRDWRNRGAFDQMLKRLHIRLNEQGLIDLDTWMIDSTAVRATRASSGTGKKGA
jgi:transposase